MGHEPFQEYVKYQNPKTRPAEHNLQHHVAAFED